MKNNKHLSQLNKTIRARNNLRNMYHNNQLSNLGLYEQVSKIQKPITKAIAETSKDTKDELEKVRNAIESQPKPLAALPAQQSHPLVEDAEDTEIQNIINNKNGSRQTNNTLTLANNPHGVRVYTIGSADNNKQLFGLKNNTTLVNIDSKEEYKIPSVGVSKLLFEPKPTEDNITKEDVDEYQGFLEHYHFNITQDSKRKIIQKYYPQTPIRQRQSFVVPEREGEGVKETVLIPSDPGKLREALILQLLDVEAGNNNNFNYTKALMKEMLSQKLINSKDYRAVLRAYFHI